ncbi:MAG: peptidylprolyl isomerase [Polyangiaceae bacterium]|nr:peptidylprolyl isomerase [Polyangiaceae bacterium]MBK8998425.1 peptidylprolyl isomerase [Myxococcales bacterium]MCL4755700.1 peptidylprolyl isomerase [Myxococcales bacterium]
MVARRPIVAAGLAGALALGGCVLTTHEGPSEPPRGAVQPIWPPLGEAPATPIQGEGEGEGAAEGTTAARPETIAARHILVMHRAGMRAPDTITRSKEEAKARAEEALKRARAGEDFAKLVNEYSDEPGAKARGGTLGRFPRGVMVKEFEKAAFALEPGQISDVVESPFGFHVIQRTE